MVRGRSFRFQALCRALGPFLFPNHRTSTKRNLTVGPSSATLKKPVPSRAQRFALGTHDNYSNPITQGLPQERPCEAYKEHVQY